MDLFGISILLKIITWSGGVFISVWVIKLLREINSKQKEYILLIEKAFQEREKTRDQKIAFLDDTHKKEIELIEKEKSIFFKTMESEKKTLQLQLANVPNSDMSLMNNLVTDLKSDLSLVVNKVSSLNILAQDLSKLKEIVGIAGDINRKVNVISNEENIFASDGETLHNKQENIVIKDYIFEIYSRIYSNSSFDLRFDDSLLNLQPIFFNKRLLYIMLMEILHNSQSHSTSNYLVITGKESNEKTIIAFENASRDHHFDLNDIKFLRKIPGPLDERPNGLYIIKDIMTRYNNQVKISTNDGRFKIELSFHHKTITEAQ